MMIATAGTRQRCLRDRLIEAADAELAECGTLVGRIESVARRAGVSRATAYRQMGSVSELLTQVGLRRAWWYLEGLREVVDAEGSTMAKLEAAMIYGARVLPSDPLVARLITRQFTSGRDPEVYEMINTMIRSTLIEGRLCGDLRTDVPVDRLIDYMVEQSYLATNASDRSADAVSWRFRTFMKPVLEAADRRDPRRTWSPRHG